MNMGIYKKKAFNWGPPTVLEVQDHLDRKWIDMSLKKQLRVEQLYIIIYGKETENERVTKRQVRERERERERDRERQRETDRQTDRQTETDRDRQRQTERGRETGNNR
jgi:hypothetical protein